MIAIMQMPTSRTIPDLLDELVQHHGDVEFVVGGAVRLSYRDFQGEVHRIARGLYALGIRPGDKVAILMGNRPEWLIANFAILQIGAIMVSINAWASQRELAYMLDHSDSRALITVDRFLGNDYLAMLQSIERDCSRPATLRHVICLGEQNHPDGIGFDRLDEIGHNAPDIELAAVRKAIDRDDVAYILYTSGSTSTPKGVQLQHGALIENMWHIGERQHLKVGDRLWLGVSLFWGFACENALFAVMTHAGTVVLQEHFEPGEALRLIEAERCSVMYATPNMVSALFDHPDRSRRDR